MLSFCELAYTSPSNSRERASSKNSNFFGPFDINSNLNVVKLSVETFPFNGPIEGNALSKRVKIN